MQRQIPDAAILHSVLNIKSEIHAIVKYSNVYFLLSHYSILHHWSTPKYSHGQTPKPSRDRAGQAGDYTGAPTLTVVSVFHPGRGGAGGTCRHCLTGCVLVAECGQWRDKCWATIEVWTLALQID